MVTTTWRGTATATASIVHGGETRGTITLLRRELILDAEGRPTYVPIISGNGFRGLLRRTGEELLRDVLDYEGNLPLAVAHALRAGGSLAKTGKEPLSGHRLANLRSLVPHVGVFGCAGGGRIIDGCLHVGKVIPHLVETRHLINPPLAASTRLLTAFEATQIETYVRQDDADTHAFAGLSSSPVDPATGQPTPDGDTAVTGPPDRSRLMMYRLETFPAGTRFSTWLKLSHATDLEAAFFADVLDTFGAHARLGGRTAIGHGTINLDLTATPDRHDCRDSIDWRAHLAANRDTALAALSALT